MPIAPIITFKAGQCDLNTSSTPAKVVPKPERGYIYLYSEDDLVHFCWRKRGDQMDEPELDLVMVPTDGSFVTYEPKQTAPSTAKPNGRIFVLKFASSSQRHLFWMQSKPQSRNGDASWFSPRDRKIGDIVHRLLQGEEVNVSREIAAVRNTDDRRDDGDEPMEDAPSHPEAQGPDGRGSGGAGPGATGGDVREEGEGPREGGADGARAASSLAPDAATAVQNFLASINDDRRLGGPQAQQHEEGQQHQQDRGRRPMPSDDQFPGLNSLLSALTTVPMLESASPEFIDSLLELLPPAVIVLFSDPSSLDGRREPTDEALEAAKASMSDEDKRSLLKKVVQTPQFQQSLSGLTDALRSGGLPGIADALRLDVENGGFKQGRVPMNGGLAVKTFVDGIKKAAREENPS